MAKRVRTESFSSCSTSSPSLFPPTTVQSSASDEELSTKCSRIDFNSQTPSPAVITCRLPPQCDARPFKSHEEFEAHYLQVHTNRCAECHRNFPSRWFLDVHIREHHDPFNQLKKERGENIFGCFVEGCDRMCSTPHKRRMHLIDKHHFPKEYNWGIITHGIDHCTSLLKNDRSQYVKKDEKKHHDNRNSKHNSPKSSSIPKNAPPALLPKAPIQDRLNEVDMENTDSISEEKPALQETPETDIATIASSMASLNLVPLSVRFGRKKVVGFSK
ncbi:hypothetical protein RUND412_007066 [Rhizina undulata]